jgi:hypothetical protein
VVGRDSEANAEARDVLLANQYLSIAGAFGSVSKSPNTSFSAGKNRRDPPIPWSRYRIVHTVHYRSRLFHVRTANSQIVSRRRVVSVSCDEQAIFF